jgi:hypothetical protein
MDIEYKLKILGEKIEYIPRQDFILPLKKSKKKIFEIKAGNGYGKTFLLNLIAYAFYADKLDNEAILKTIKDRVSDYSDENAYDLEYKLSFDLPDGKNILLSKQNSKERLVQIDNSPPIGVKQLQKQVTILYDVPIDPSLRLKEVIKDLGVWNNKLRDKFIEYNNFLDDIENQFSSVRDDEKIKNYEKILSELEQDIKSKKTSKSNCDDALNSLNYYLNLNKLANDLRSSNDLNNELTKKQKEFKSCPKPKKIDKKDEQLIKKLQVELLDLKKQFKGAILELIESVSKKDDLFNYIKNDNSLNSIFDFLNDNDIESIINDDDYIDVIENFNRKLKHFTDCISDFISKEESGKKYIVHNFLNQLLEQIDELIENGADNILEVLTNNETSIIKKEIEKRIIEHRIVSYNELKKIISNLPSAIKSILASSIKLNSKIMEESKKKGVDSDGEKYYMLKSEIENLNSRLQTNKLTIERNRYNLARDLGYEPSLLVSLDEVRKIKDYIQSKVPSYINFNNLTQELNTLNRESKQLDEQIKEKDKNVGFYKALLTNESNKIKSQYSDDQQQKIKNFKRRLQMIIANFKSFSDLIININDGNLDRLENDEDVKFINVAGKIIAYSMDNKILRSDGKYVILEYYDLKKKEFYCAGDIIIRKDDISTGLASANYLRQRIENVEGDYVLILLDEIGNMAQDTLHEVIKSIKKLEEQNRLVIAVLTQPSGNKEQIIINEY